MNMGFLYIFHRIGFISISYLHSAAAKMLFRGISKKQVDIWVKNFLDTNLEKILRPSLANELAKGNKEGHATALFSSSPDFLVLPIAERLAIDHVAAVTWEVDSRNNLLGPLGRMSGEEKALELERAAKQSGVNLEMCTAYSDSILDLAFLEKAGSVYLVCPDRRLKRIGSARGWNFFTVS